VAQLSSIQLCLFDETIDAALYEQSAPLGNYQVVDSWAMLSYLEQLLQNIEYLALDTETTSTNAIEAKLVGISVAVQPGKAYYIPLGHSVGQGMNRQLPLETVVAVLQPVLANKNVAKVLHNAKYDMMVLSRYGLTLQGTIYDTMIAAWLLSPSGRGIGLKAQAWQRLGVEMQAITELIGTGRKQTTMDRVTITRVTPYACADADITLRLLPVLRAELKLRQQWDLFTQLEMPFIPVLIAMEEQGMLIDASCLQTMSQAMQQQLDELTAQIYKYAGYHFNLNSTKQLSIVLFEELKLPIGCTTNSCQSRDGTCSFIVSSDGYKHWSNLI